MCVRSLGYIVGASPPLRKYVCLFVGLHCGCVPHPVKIRVSVRWGKLWVRPPPSVKICVSVCWVTSWVRPPPLCVRSIGNTVGVSPLVCVLSLEDNLRWILACCLLRFAAFLGSMLPQYMALSVSLVSFRV